MLNLIPAVKQLEIREGFLDKKSVFYGKGIYDKRIEMALGALPFDAQGTPVEIVVSGDVGEAYGLWIGADGIKIEAESNKGAFYAVQTLRQILANGEDSEIPYLEIHDKPDMEYRGFYHDVTRGKIPTVETLKKLIDLMAYYKMNSLQIYVEHVYEFEECKDLNERCGYLTKAEMQELDQYCKDRFIDFIPSLSTFGHLYELLELPQYKHLRVLKNFVPSENVWHERMAHHTIDPLNPESEALVKSLIDQYMPAFTSEIFNICCDETFDLGELDSEIETGKLYVDFTKKIIEYVKSKGKKVMMWADILLEHPEYIEEIPADTYFLNWEYAAQPNEEKIIKFEKMGRKQIVCPGTSSWRRLCEDVAVEEQNISLTAEYGYKHGALGVLNTNWGDWGNPSSLDLAMYGMVLGAAKSWAVETEINDAFYSAVNQLLYGADGAIQHLKMISAAQNEIKWMPFTKAYLETRYGKEVEPELPVTEFMLENVKNVQSTYAACRDALAAQTWKYEEAREEMLLCIEGICVMAELTAKMKGLDVVRMTDTKSWVEKCSAKWEQKNKKYELSSITEMFLYLEEN